MVKMCIKCGVKEQRGHNSYCADCHNEYQKAYYKIHPQSIRDSVERRKARNREAIRRAKDQPCADCGRSYPYYVMDFDHVRGTKRFNLSTGAQRFSFENILAEIAKCDVVCANCHRSRTFTRTSFRDSSMEEREFLALDAGGSSPPP